MPLTVLSDAQVRSLLHFLTRQDILDLQQSLADALHFYSTSAEGNACCSSYQPLRTSLRRTDGGTTLVMPASSNEGMGVKIVTLPPLEDNSTEIDLTTSLANLHTRPKAAPQGSITLLDKDGAPRALINAEEITAFRTALASTMLFRKRRNVHDICVFGAGKQAYWHIRLALLLRGEDVHHVNIINRTFPTAQKLLEQLFGPRLERATEIHRPKIAIITSGHTEYERLLKSTVRGSNVIFCTTPSLAPLFPASYLTNPEGRRKGRYIAAVGSYKPHMVELHPDIVRQAVAPHTGHHYHKHARTSGAIVVDSVEACMKEAGEVIQAGLAGHEVVELGELVMLRKEAERRRREAATASASADHGLDSSGVEIKQQGNAAEDGSLKEWLERGNVIYKSVGLGLMDVVVGGDVVNLADRRGVGTKIEDF